MRREWMVMGKEEDRRIRKKEKEEESEGEERGEREWKGTRGNGNRWEGKITGGQDRWKGWRDVWNGREWKGS